MAATNDITGDAIQTRTITDAYRNNYDLIFGKKKRGSTDDTLREFQPTTDQGIEETHNGRDRARSQDV